MADASPSPDRADKDAPHLERRPARIFLVEDNPADVRLTREMLQEAKVANALSVAHDAEEAERMLGLTGNADAMPRPDLILLDLHLPGKSGHELLTALNKHPTLRRIPVVILTSSEAAEDIAKSYDRYANAYVTKPVNLDAISKIVRSIDDFWLQVVRLPSDSE